MNRPAIDLQSTSVVPIRCSAKMPSESIFSYVRDADRLRALIQTQLLDSPPEEGFDRFTRLASRMLRCRVSLISLVDSQSQFFKSQVGLHFPWCEMGGTPLDHSMCATVVETRDVLMIEDAREDPSWQNHLAVRNIGVVSYLGFPLHSPDGRHILGSFCVIDSGPRKWSEIDLEVMNDLTHTVEEKIRLRAEIEKSTQIAIRLNETNTKIREFTEHSRLIMATVAHEIRTAATSLSGHAEIAVSSMDPNERDASIQAIRRNTEHLVHLVNDNLESAKIESGQIRFESIVFDAVKFSKEIVESLAPNVCSKPVRLIFETTEDTIAKFVSADPTRIRQILLNLMANAIKFTEFGTVTLRLDTEVRELSPDHPTPSETCILCWQVIDTGAGMTPEQVDSLFRPYVQADATIHRRFGGSGMGLFISKELAEAMGGTIEVRSEPGAGTTFTVRLPVEIPTSSELADRQPESAMPEKLEGNPRVLVVEDNPDIRQIQNFLLKRAGCDPVHASDGSEAVEIVSSSNVPFDLILMDVFMPVMDGRQATKAIRELGYRGPMISLTASFEDEELQRMQEAGCDAHMRKPMDLKDFIRKARALMKPQDGSSAIVRFESGVSIE
ncbi:response regulator [bacterium]|nr:response regulator [bacterium]